MALAICNIDGQICSGIMFHIVEGALCVVCRRAFVRKSLIISICQQHDTHNLGRGGLVFETVVTHPIHDMSECVFFFGAPLF